jgi:hypothetical protein
MADGAGKLRKAKATIEGEEELLEEAEMVALTDKVLRLRLAVLIGRDPAAGASYCRRTSCKMCGRGAEGGQE